MLAEHPYIRGAGERTMFGTELYEFERQSLIQAVGGYWLSTTSDDKKKQIIRKVAAIFKQWRADHATKHSNGRNALGALSVALGAIGRDEFEELKLHKENILLAFDLWLKGNASFRELTNKHGLYRVFAVIGQNAHKDASVSSLVRLSAFLAEPLNQVAKAVTKSAKDAQVPAHASAAVKAMQREIQSKISKSGGDATKTNSEMFAATLERYMRDHLQLAEAKIVEFVGNTKPDSHAVVWEHGKKFKGRPWNAKNKQRLPHKGLAKRVRRLGAQIRRERVSTYGKA